MNTEYEEIIGETLSVCPVCLERITAQRVRRGENIYLKKECGKHGKFETVIWRGKPDYLEWAKKKEPEYPKTPLTPAKRGCPYDCGLCPEHSQRICCAQIEVTERCNLYCPVCFACAKENAAPDPSLEQLLGELRHIWETNGRCSIQLSGGEPTVRDDLPELIRRAGEIGYTFFQLNTNGLRLSEEPAYVQELKEAGLSTVFLQFDGTRDDIYKKLRGKELLAMKEKVIEECGRQGLGVVLVPTLTPGVNTDNIGEIVSFALSHMPVVRGVHFQPISYFGRYPHPPADEDRITLPEVLQELERQTGGLVKIENFVPSDCENAVCSFHGDFICLADGTLLPVTGKDSCGSEEPSAVRAQNFVANRWQLLNCCGEKEEQEKDGLDTALEYLKNRRLSITCMAFQDGENLDLERLKYCCVPVIVNGKAIPFCAYNLTSRDGLSLYRKKAYAE